MPRILDNIDQSLLPSIQNTIQSAYRADFCVGYFNLRGWRHIAHAFDNWEGGYGKCCRVLVGMQRAPQDEVRAAFRVTPDDDIDNQTVLHLKKQLAEDFRNQITIGTPTNADEAGLRHLANQLKAQKVIVKLYLQHPLHAKLYLLFRTDTEAPIVGYVGSSNLTFSGLVKQGELNVHLPEEDAGKKLQQWFDDRWNNRRCIDISQELIQVIEESWAREQLISPYHIYIKMAYHLAQEARTGVSEFCIPSDFSNTLFPFQQAAIQIAAYHLNKRGGVLLGDVVGLGKTLMATTLARIFEDDYFLETLILCPVNLVKMWEDYAATYRLHAKVLPISHVIRELPTLRRYRLLIIDESHNLRNREGQRYRAIQEYIHTNECRVILLSATPYNKSYLDLASQLRLFVAEDQELTIKPERLLRDIGESEFIRRYQTSPRTLAAFEKSDYADDWRDLMRFYLVRRTRSFIQQNYAETDPQTQRRYLSYPDGRRAYFPTRVPRTVTFAIDDQNPDDQYARLYALSVVDSINNLTLPRYGLAGYMVADAERIANAEQKRILTNLSRAGKRLMGFCRTNLFKRLESSGQVFLQSIERHILRNFIVLHALENNKPVPIGTQDAALLDTRMSDVDMDATIGTPSSLANDDSDQDTSQAPPSHAALFNATEAQFKQVAATIYQQYETAFANRFAWLPESFFTKQLATDLLNDAHALIKVLHIAGLWDVNKDTKLEALQKLIEDSHPNEKILIFTQFADTVSYVTEQLQRLLPTIAIEGVTGQTDEPTSLAWRFSPRSNGVSYPKEIQVLIATDVLSEGQNLQDAHIVVNYDLPWAIIRLIQRAGRVDRIGQQAEEILSYTFLPADGIERIINLRERIRNRLQQNAEVIGTDEAFFEDDKDTKAMKDLFTEQSGILDGEADTEVDLASYAYQIWKNAVDADPSLQRIIPTMPPVVYATRSYTPTPHNMPAGVLLYMRNRDGNDSLAWIDTDGNSVTESQLAILHAAACHPNTAPQERMENHHDLVKTGIQFIAEQERNVGGQLGRPSGIRFRTYERLKRYAEKIRGTFFDNQDIHRAVEDIYRYPLRQTAADTLNRQLRSGITDETLAQLVLGFHEEHRLCLIHEATTEDQEPTVICSLGLKPTTE